MIEFKFDDSPGESLDVLYSVSEVAARTRVCTRTVYRAIASRELAAHRLRGCLRISPQSLNRWLEDTALTDRPVANHKPPTAVQAARRPHQRPSGRLRPLLEAKS
jgi:excisionase family DNA binding protein